MNNSRIPVTSFLKLVISINFATKYLALVTLISFMVHFLSKESSSMASFHLGRLYKELAEETRITSFIPFLTFSFLHCFMVSFIYWISPAHKCAIVQVVNAAMIKNCLKLGFEDFYGVGAAKMRQRMDRNVAAIAECSSILVFDLIGNFITIASAIKKIGKMIEAEIFFKLGITLLFLGLSHFFINFKVKSSKKQCVEVREDIANEMNELYSNFSLVKMTGTNESKRIEQTFRSAVFLNYEFVSKLPKLVNAILFVMVDVYVLYYSSSVKKHVFNYLAESILLFKALDSIISSGFKLETKRQKINKLIKGSTDAEDSWDSFRADISENKHISEINSWKDPNSGDFYSQLQVKAFRDLPINTITFEDVTIFVKGLPIVHIPSLVIRRHEKIAILGKNGSGKSTFLKFLLGFFKFTGNIAINGEDIDDKSEIIRKYSSYLSQNRNIQGSVLEAFQEHTDDDSQIIELCKQFNISNTFSELKISDLNESDQQLIHVMKVYSKRSSILLGDEPIDSLCLEDQGPVLDVLLNSKHHDTKIIAIHNVNFLSKFDRIFVFKNNSLVAYSYDEFVELKEKM